MTQNALYTSKTTGVTGRFLSAFVRHRFRLPLYKPGGRRLLRRLSHRSSSSALDFAYAVDLASKKSVFMRLALEYWLTHAMEAGSCS